jgi:hypothetical protein
MFLKEYLRKAFSKFIKNGQNGNLIKQFMNNYEPFFFEIEVISMDIEH